MIKLYLDEDVHKKVALSLRLKGYDAVSAHEVHNWGLTDADQLKYAASEGRAIFTYNSVDFTRLNKEYIDKGRTHSGILSSKQTSLSETLKKLTAFLNTHGREEIINGFFWI